MIKNVRVTLCVILLVVVISALIVSPYAAGNDTDASTTRTVVDSDGIVYKISFFEGGKVTMVNISNPTYRDGDHTGYSIKVDGQRVQDKDFSLDKNEQRTEVINITSGINVNQDNHTITFSTYENSTQFNFTREIDSTDPGNVPVPYIADVEITTGTIEGEQSAVAEVTVVNPSDQLYSTKLFVHTVGTDGSLYPASVRPGDSRVITVELLDDRGDEIAGEARLYTGNLTTEDGAMDQVEFAGQAGEETKAWNTSYESVRPTWMNDNYQYQNDSYSQSFAEEISGGHKVSGVPVAYLVVGLLVGFVVFRKFR